MIENTSFATKVLQFNGKLSLESVDLPAEFKIINPFTGKQKEYVKKITTMFYQKYYDDTHPRRLILGSSPSRRGSSVTGIPFEDAEHLQKVTGIIIDNFYINRSNSGFIYDVIEKYGNYTEFYYNFYMNFVCPLGIVRINKKGKEVNCNYYENKKLQEALYPFIIDSIRSQLDFGIDTSVCYCIGSGENFNFLSKVNQEHNFFGSIIPLEHPRFIMQYNSKRKDEFIDKYVNAFQGIQNG